MVQSSVYVTETVKLGYGFHLNTAQANLYFDILVQTLKKKKSTNLSSSFQWTGAWCTVHFNYYLLLQFGICYLYSIWFQDWYANRVLALSSAITKRFWQYVKLFIVWYIANIILSLKIEKVIDIFVVSLPHFLMY